MMRIRLRLPGVEKSVLQEISFAACRSRFSACRIWAISKTTSGSRVSPPFAWKRASTRAASDSCNDA